jgi:signal transduction histidine kinase
MNRLSAFLAVLGVGATAAGCASMGSALTDLNNSILRPEHVRGTYELVRLGDSDLPLRTQLNETVECPGGGISARSEVREGRLSLSSDGTIVFDAAAILHCSNPSEGHRADSIPQRVTGSYMLTSDGVIRVSLSGGRRLVLSYDSAAAEIHSADMGGLWRRPAVNVASPERGGAAGIATATVAREYQLSLANGDPLPVALNPLRGCDRRLTGGTLELAEHGNFRLQTSISETCPGSSSASVLTYEGTFEQSGDYINFVEPGRLGNFRGVLRGLEIDLPLGSLRLSFLAGAYTPVDPTEALFAEVQQRVQSYRPDHAYDCTQDPLLAGAPPIAVRDTAGLGSEWGQEIAMRHVLQEDRPAFQQAFARAVETGVLSFEVRVRLPDGGIHWIAPVGRTYYDAEGRPVRMAGVVADITESRLAQETAERARIAERASDAKSQFLATMSHELRTPLTGVIGYADLLESEVLGPVSPRQNEALARIRASSWHLVSIIDEILTLSRAEAGRVEKRVEEVDMAGIACEIVRMLEPEAARAGLGLYLRNGGEEPAIVWTDAGKVRQILLNLVGNAVRYTRLGMVTLEVDRSVAERIAVHVRDTGPGIAIEDQERIFESFTQLDSSLTRAAGGTGLGLAISRRLAQLLGGDIELRSTPGEGSTFTLSLPRRDRGEAQRT